jgi:hypothetical protein
MAMKVITTCLSTFNISGCCTVRKHFLYNIHQVFSNAEVSHRTTLNKINTERISIKYSMPPYYGRDAFLKSVPVM